MSKVTPPPNPHQDEIDRLMRRILPRVLAMPFAQNPREPWLGNTTVNKAVLATITTIFILADEDAAAKAAFLETQNKVSSEDDQPPNLDTILGPIEEKTNGPS